tara:strand:- start:2982 stop:3644 length:663 start_codon:yes stop_codon:yes gene_type:complete
MTSKTTKTPAKNKPAQSHVLTVPGGKTKEEDNQFFAKAVISPELATSRVITAVEYKSGISEHLDLTTLVAELEKHTKATSSNDLSHAEKMLANQAIALQSLFARLVERGMSCDTINPFESNMRMALRAQSQCRATLETLATIKNPPIVYARQANVTTGPQQINNGINVPSARAEKQNPPNQLLENENDKRMDTGATSTTGRGDKALEAVGKVNRTEDRGR